MSFVSSDVPAQSCVKAPKGAGWQYQYYIYEINYDRERRLLRVDTYQKKLRDPFHVALQIRPQISGITRRDY